MAQWEALEERRAISIRHARFNVALVASFIFNANRGKDSRPLSPFDFIPGFEEDPEDVERREKRESIKQAIAEAFTRTIYATPEQAQQEKRAMIARMTARGVEDPEGLIREVFPDL